MNLHSKTFTLGLVTLAALAGSSMANAQAEKGNYKIDPVTDDIEVRFNIEAIRQ